MIFSGLQGLAIPEGVVTQISKDGDVIWVLSSDKIVLEVEKITSDTYAGDTTYTGEQFILLDIYPKTNGTVTVTYGDLTKTIVDTSGAAEPNAQQIVFGTFNGVSDSVATPVSGELTIEGDCYAFGTGMYKHDKTMNYSCGCITRINKWGLVEVIPKNAFNFLLAEGIGLSGDIIIPSTVKRIGDGAFCYANISSVVIPSSVEHIGTQAFTNTDIAGDLVIPSSVAEIGYSAFCYCNALSSVTIGEGISVIGYGAFMMSTVMGATSGLSKVVMLAKNPPTLTIFEGDESSYYNTFGVAGDESYLLPNQIIVPKGCGNVYKTTQGWSTYADLIVEAS